MRINATAEDANGLHSAAHTLKPNAAQLGAIKLSNLCLELEKIARAGMLEKAPEKITEIAAEYDRIRQVLEVEEQKFRKSQ